MSNGKVNHETHLMDYYIVIKLFTEIEATWKMLTFMMLSEKGQNTNVYIQCAHHDYVKQRKTHMCKSTKARKCTKYYRFLQVTCPYPLLVFSTLSMCYFYNRYIFSAPLFFQKQVMKGPNTPQGCCVLSYKVHNQTQCTCDHVAMGKLPPGSYILHSCLYHNRFLKIAKNSTQGT